MILDSIVCALLLAIGLVPIFALLKRDRRARAVIVATVVLVILSSWLLAKDRARGLKRAKEDRVLVPRSERAEYVGSQRCQACHPREHATWHDTYHRTMTQVASPETVLGQFANTELFLGGEKYVLSREGDDYWVEMTDVRWKANQQAGQNVEALGTPPRTKYPVRMLTGSHHMQVCWISPGAGNLQLLAPFAWLKEDQRWAPFHQTFLRDPAIPPGPQIWNKFCINCHSTGPIPRHEPSQKTYDTRVGELGISCEACHGPAEEHIKAQQNPALRYAAHTRDRKARPDNFITNPAKLSSRLSAQTCGQCHGIHWIRDARAWNEVGSPFRPGMELEGLIDLVEPAKAHAQVWAEPLRKNPKFAEDRYWPDGMVRVSGREFNGVAQSPCYEKGELSCLSCHSMHGSKPNDQLAPRRESNDACLQCHTRLAANVSEHTHHAPGSAGSLCYNCHMPFTTYGLLKGIRSHQIDSPNAAVSQKTGRPNACNGCHLDQTLAWTADYLETWYQIKKPNLPEDAARVSATVLHALKGDAGQRALAAFALGWDEAQMASGKDWIVPHLAQLLDDPYSAVRYIAHRSLRSHPAFNGLQFDFTKSPAEREPMSGKVIQAWRSSPPINEPLKPATLIKTERELEQESFRKILLQRDDKSIDLQE